MKYCIVIFIVLLAILDIEKSFSQISQIKNNYDYDNFVFVGYKDDLIIYQYFPIFGTRYNENEKFNLYSVILKKDQQVIFKLYKEFNYNVDYIINDCLLYRENSERYSLLRNNEKLSIERIGNVDIYDNTHSLTQYNYFYFSTEIRDIDYLARIDLKQESPKMEVLPIKGRKPIIYNGWLFYEIDYMSPKYSDPPDAIYRVKIGDWRNPELIVNDVYFGGTVINENLISFRVYEKEKIRDVTYNILEKSYVETDIAPLIKYKDKYYQNTLCKDEKTGKTQICYTDVPELPDKFPHEFERQVEPNQNFLYLPHTQKPFAGTFITDSLMFFANKEQLKKLSKPQLRKLRNAFYAREGFDFDSKDLNDFFSQFQWYIKTLKQRRIKNSSNDDIYIPPMDMNRINLIKSVENMK